MGREGVYTIVLICGVVVFGTLNNFAGKMKAETMGTYNFVTGIVDTYVHLITNAVIVAGLLAFGVVTRSQLAFVFRFGKRWGDIGIWKYIAIASVSDVANNITGLASQPYLTALMMSLMDQATTPFTVACSFVMLGTRYSALESCSVVVIMCAAVAGVLVVQKDTSGDNSAFWAAFAAATTSFAAVSFVLKEMSFRMYTAFWRTTQTSPVPGRTEFRGSASAASLLGSSLACPNMPETLNVFLVSLIVSIGGAITVVPVALINRAATSSDSPLQALRDGFTCLQTCGDALNAYIFATAINYVFNFCLLALTSRGSALLAFVSLKVVVPCTALCSLFPWPLIGKQTVSSSQWGILAIMLLALSSFRYGNIQRERLRLDQCCWPFCRRSPSTSNPVDMDPTIECS